MKKIVHISLCGPYTEGWGYQENILSKYQRKLGYEVALIVPNYSHNNEGSIIEVEECNYKNDDGISVFRINNSNGNFRLINKTLIHYKIYPLICSLKPSIIMIHGLTSITTLQAIKYIKKNTDCKIIVDTHADENNTKLSGSILFKMYKLYVRFLNSYTQKYVERIYAITPSCEEIARNFYGISLDKIQLLPLGYDDDLARVYLKKKNPYMSIYGIKANEIILITGGKLDEKKNIHSLLEAFEKLDNQKLHLFIFGEFVNLDYRHISMSKLDKTQDRVHFLGMLSQKEIYRFLSHADIAIFPGTQSALWQQALGCGLPLVIRHWKHTDYLNFNNNVLYMESGSTDDIKEKLFLLSSSDEIINTLKSNANVDEKEFFSYTSIAKRTLL